VRAEIFDDFLMKALTGYPLRSKIRMMFAPRALLAPVTSTFIIPYK
jgi:hypothetical protein